ncbi:hypothetical protein MP228_008209 [Amoeboaphelidium protococcarum]|nr:hypothetical protein MP228_008209 [Amoeboaphelidium protococcarum]
MFKCPISWQDLLIAVVITAHCLLSPFTKVEESFNLQAVHDILHHGINVSEYDHLQFPGVVSRTFIGALVLSAVSYPTISLYRLIAPCHSSLHDQVIVRISLGLLTAFALGVFRRSVQKHYGWLCSVMFTLLSVSQFHLMYYASRTLPNIFAFNIVMVSFSVWMDLHSLVQKSVKARNQIIDQLIWAAAIAGIIFRSELIILYLPLFAMEMFVWRTVGISRLLWSSLKAAVACLVLTITIDSYFWQRWLYPEGEVLWFNTIQNQSHHWGVNPVHAYVTIFLPKLTLSSYLMFLLAKSPQILIKHDHGGLFGITARCQLECNISNDVHINVKLSRRTRAYVASQQRQPKRNGLGAHRSRVCNVWSIAIRTLV